MTVAVETMPVQDMGEIMNGAGSEHQGCFGLYQWSVGECCKKF